MARRRNRDELLEESGMARKLLHSAIKLNIRPDLMEKAVNLPKSQLMDAVEKVLMDAVKATPIVSFSGIPHVYDLREGVYKPFDYHDMELALYDAMREGHVPNGCYGYVAKTVKLCWAECQSRKAEVDTSVVVMPNGVYDTMDSSMHEWSEKYLTNMKVDYPYNALEEPIAWKRFLNEVLPDIEMQLLLQEFVAAAYIDRRIAKFEHMLILLGRGSNGKSVVFEVINGLLGDNNISNFSIADLIGGSRRDQYIAMCNGKRLNYCSEIRTREIGDRNADAFKALVSGEPQMARSLYREPFRATEIPIIMANANKLPKLSDASYSIQRRILIIPFETFIAEEDQNKELADQLKYELSGIFNWMLQGLAALRANKYQLNVPMKVRQLVSDYIKDNNSMAEWTAERRMFAHWHPQTGREPEWKGAKFLYDNYCDWCFHEGFEKLSMHDFADEMRALDYQHKRRSTGAGYMVYYAPSEEDIRAANMEIALGMMNQEYLKMLKESAAKLQKVQVEGMEDLERYLGLPKDCIWPYMQSGQLDGTYTREKGGRLMFDVKEVQASLAKAGFYQELKSDTNSCKRRATNVLKGMRQSFNASMKAMGVPIRKYGNVYGYIPIADKDCYIVPDDWQYSKRAADLVMMQRKENIQQVSVPDNIKL